MQSTVYRCDECEKIIGHKVHLSLSFAQFSGIAVPPKDKLMDKWRIGSPIAGKFLHFCSTEHLKKYFDSLLQKYSRFNAK